METKASAITRLYVTWIIAHACFWSSWLVWDSWLCRLCWSNKRMGDRHTRWHGAGLFGAWGRA
ncbi:hypothetical protein K504DRAFT_170853 [Pleomassaria siparia CBS 279.74]|uniref:Uncharacterized protein n=1 Tax=Pleomassaria siparia CBS 279.74 TaxID=1314801 RepID=A0A6G1JU51_9PLEO|nr:hypothetical protein K504DRAFT_170853 [Pleomassaria siparia CBS 279.74]